MHRYDAARLADRLQGAEPPTLLDVRESWEWDICRLDGSLHIPMGQIPGRLAELDPTREIVVLCHLGARSLQVGRFLESQGYRWVADLQGGLAAWAQEVDPAMETY